MISIDEKDLSDSVIDNLSMVYYSKVDSDMLKCEEYEKKQEVCSNLEDAFRETLSKEQQKELYKLTQSINKINFKFNKAYFKEGFIQGVNLMLEIHLANKK